jgi:hypothetical protein
MVGIKFESFEFESLDNMDSWNDGCVNCTSYSGHHATEMLHNELTIINIWKIIRIFINVRILNHA